MSFFEFPHTRTYDNDLGWLIRRLTQISEELRNFINFNTIKYADPIAWNITTQYEGNTVVINPADGTAYISTKPVPSGVLVTNTDYWTPIFNYGESLDTLREQIAAANEENGSGATKNYVTDELLWWNDELYRVLYDFNAGTQFIIDGNITHTTVEQELARLGESVSGDITAINENIQNINDAISAMGDRIDRLDVFIDPREYGAVGDGVTDDTAAFTAAIAAAVEMGGATVIVPKDHTFIVTRISISGDNVRMLGLGGVIKLKDGTAASGSTAYYIIDAYNKDNIILENLEIDGNAANNDDFSVCDAITCAGGDNNVIRGCHIVNAPDAGIMFSDLTNSMCIDNVIEGFRDCGIYCNKGSGNDGAFNIVSRNVIDGGTLNPNGSGIALKRVCWKFIVTENMIHNVTNGITLENASASNDYSTDILIANNWIEYFSVYGINLRASFRCVVSGNYIKGSDANYGILIDGNSRFNSVSNNIITEINKFAGIGFTMRDSHFPKDNIISNNNINVAAPFGINMPDSGAAPGAQSINNNITGNIIKTTYENGIGIYVGTYFQKTAITGNIISGANKDATFKAGMCIISGNSFEHHTAENLTAAVSNRVGSIGTAQIFSAPNAAVVPTAVNAAPGDITLNSAPASGGYVGWVYNGSAWLPFGAIV